MEKLDAVILMVDGCRGVYVPKSFIESIADIKWEGISPDDHAILQNPEHEWYWESWNTVLNNAYYMNGTDKYTLHQDDDLWAICYEKMTDEDKKNFGFED
jgi:hypothetical protein